MNSPVGLGRETFGAQLQGVGNRRAQDIDKLCDLFRAGYTPVYDATESDRAHRDCLGLIRERDCSDRLSRMNPLFKRSAPVTATMTAALRADRRNQLRRHMAP